MICILVFGLNSFFGYASLTERRSVNSSYYESSWIQGQHSHNNKDNYTNVVRSATKKHTTLI